MLAGNAVRVIRVRAIGRVRLGGVVRTRPIGVIPEGSGGSGIRRKGLAESVRRFRSGSWCLLGSLVAWDHNCVTGDDCADSDHCQPQPTGRLNTFSRLGIDLHKERRHRGVVCDRRTLVESSEGASGRFVQNKRMHHAKLNSQQNQQDSHEKISVAVKGHEFLNSFVANGRKAMRLLHRRPHWIGRPI